MSIKQTARIISTYTGDTSGVCSALYELGGMTIMHDASGCNSTYNTHDEPRWYDMDSLVFISALTEIEALMGDDNKIIGDAVRAARELSPAFITVAGTPIPMMIGTDFAAVAGEIERETGIPTFGIATDGMHSYISGASQAYANLARRLCEDGCAKKTDKTAVNVLGATPLDFSINGTVEAMRSALKSADFEIGAVWAMGCTLEELRQSGAADVNLVVSACGLETAKILRERFGTPYVVGTPCGEKFTARIIEALRRAADTGGCAVVCEPCREKDTVIIGESVTALSLANALAEETGRGALAVCAVDTSPELLSDGCVLAWDEDDIAPYLEGAARIIADPLYRPICPPSAQFIELPHEAFSGRIYRDRIPELVTGLEQFIIDNKLNQKEVET